MLESNKSSRSVVHPLEAGSSHTHSLGLVVSPGTQLLLKEPRNGFADVPHTDMANWCHINASAAPVLSPSDPEVNFENTRARPSFTWRLSGGASPRSVCRLRSLLQRQVRFDRCRVYTSVVCGRRGECHVLSGGATTVNFWNASPGPSVNAPRPGSRCRPGKARAARFPSLCPAVCLRHR